MGLIDKSYLMTLRTGRGRDHQREPRSVRHCLGQVWQRLLATLRGSLRTAPHWLGFVRAFCLCKLSAGLQGSFRRTCLCLVKSRFPTAETDLALSSGAAYFRFIVIFLHSIRPIALV